MNEQHSPPRQHTGEAQKLKSGKEPKQSWEKVTNQNWMQIPANQIAPFCRVGKMQTIRIVDNRCSPIWLQLNRIVDLSKLCAKTTLFFLCANKIWTFSWGYFEKKTKISTFSIYNITKFFWTFLSIWLNILEGSWVIFMLFWSTRGKLEFYQRLQSSAFNHCTALRCLAKNKTAQLSRKRKKPLKSWLTFRNCCPSTTPKSSREESFLAKNCRISAEFLANKKLRMLLRILLRNKREKKINVKKLHR